WECPSRRSNTQKLSNQVTTPCSLAPLTRKIVRGTFFLRTKLRKVSCRFCGRSTPMSAILFCSWRRGQRILLVKKPLVPFGHRLLHRPLRLRDLFLRLQDEAAGMPSDSITWQVGNKLTTTSL